MLHLFLQQSAFRTILKPVSSLIFGIALYLPTVLFSPFVFANSETTGLYGEVNATPQLDLSADAIDYRNNSVPDPYVPTTHWLMTSRATDQTRDPVPLVVEQADIWQEIRAGFKLEPFDHKLVKRHEKRYTRNPQHFERILERAATYLPYFLEQTNQQNLPTEIVLLPLIESAYNPRVYSSRGAAGLWQFMPATGRLYGLNQDWWYEGRRDITYSTQAALKHLVRLNKKFDGNWPLTFAAYNAGSNGIKRAIKSNQRKDKATDLGSLRLNSETRNYYPKLMAVKNIIQNPTAYGIELPKASPQSPFEIVEFDFQVDLGVLANAIEIDPLQLALLNPGLRRHATPPNGPFRVLVPTKTLNKTLAWKQDLHPSQAISSIVHVVKAGDTLSEIAQEYSVPLASLKTINSKSSYDIRIGEVIRIPVPDASGDNFKATAGWDSLDLVHTVVAGDSLSRIAKQYNVKLSNLRAMNGLSPNAHLIKIGQQLQIPDGQLGSYPPTATATAANSASRVTHLVTKGESLWSIARKYKVRVSDILHWNKIGHSAYIHPGQNLTIFGY